MQNWCCFFAIFQAYLPTIHPPNLPWSSRHQCNWDLLPWNFCFQLTCLLQQALYRIRPRVAQQEPCSKARALRVTILEFVFWMFLDSVIPPCNSKDNKMKTVRLLLQLLRAWTRKFYIVSLRCCRQYDQCISMHIKCHFFKISTMILTFN